MKIDELVIESLTAKERFWFIDDLQIERTDSTVDNYNQKHQNY